MRLVEQWERIEAGLPEGWSDARLQLTLSDPRQEERALALLGPLAPGRVGKGIRLVVARRGAGPSPDVLKRALKRLDRSVIKGQLELLATDRAVEVAQARRPTLAADWDAAVAELPEDWSDLHCEVELTSSDDFERAALLMAPLNPSRFGDTRAFRFRVARRFGYGASAQMARRCLERLDEARVPGELRILRVLSDTKPVSTQGPVWYVGGKAV